MSVKLSPASQREMDRAVQRLADAAGSTIKETLTSQARLLCVDFAANTRPLENGVAGKKKVEENIEKRIFSIYVPVGVAFEMLETHKKGYGAAFLRMLKAGKTAEAAGYLSKYSRKKFEIGSFDGGTLHRQQAFNGRTTKRMVVTDFPAVKKYAATVKKRVGFAKGGFAAAARQLGGTRGIPGYASRQPAPGTGSVTGDGKSITVTLVNGVKYARLALTPEKETQALNFRKRQIDAVLKRMMDRKSSGVSRSLK